MLFDRLTTIEPDWPNVKITGAIIFAVALIRYLNYDKTVRYFCYLPTETQTLIGKPRSMYRL